MPSFASEAVDKQGTGRSCQRHELHNRTYLGLLRLAVQDAVGDLWDEHVGHKALGAIKEAVSPPHVKRGKKQNSSCHNQAEA